MPDTNTVLFEGFHSVLPGNLELLGETSLQVLGPANPGPRLRTDQPLPKSIWLKATSELPVPWSRQWGSDQPPASFPPMSPGRGARPRSRGGGSVSQGGVPAHLQAVHPAEQPQWSEGAALRLPGHEPKTTQLSATIF